MPRGCPAPARNVALVGGAYCGDMRNASRAVRDQMRGALEALARPDLERLNRETRDQL
jgi:hypothetical protein